MIDMFNEKVTNPRNMLLVDSQAFFSSSWEFSALSLFRVFDRAAKSPNTSMASLAVPFLNKQNKSRLIYIRSN